MKPQRHFPLRIHLVTLFTALVLLAGALVGGYNQWVMRAQLDAAAAQQAVQIAERTGAEIESLIRPVELALKVLGRGQQLDVPADFDDSALRDTLRTLLDEQPQLDAVYVGDAQGRFYLLRSLAHAAQRLQQKAPVESHYLAQHITVPKQQARYTFLAKDLRTLSTEQRPDYAQRYDPRERPWYQQTQREGGLVRTAPYRFFTTQQLGLTLAWASPDFPDRVLGADVTLDTLATQLRKQRLTPGHRLALVNDRGELMAADAASTKIGDFSARQGWQSSRVPVSLGLTLWSLIPEAELQAGARAAITRSLYITLGLLALTLPLSLWLSRRITRSLQRLSEQALAIKHFEFDDQPPLRSRISEVAKLDEAMASMRRSIRRFVEVTGALAEETDFERLQLQLLKLTLPAVDAQAGVLYLMEGESLQARCAWRQDGHSLSLALPDLRSDSPVGLVAAALSRDETLGGQLAANELAALGLQEPTQGLQLGGAIVVPLHNRKRDRIGALLLLCEAEPLPSRMRFAQALAASAATAIETRELIQAQRALFESFIQLIAAAIDAKSPYTGGHCARVPELTKALAQAACNAKSGPFADFQLSPEEWEALHVGAWLHDCGKVTTPDSVVDKATKLETIYNRIHELRMRFELLKRDAELAHLQRLLQGDDEGPSAQQRDSEQARLNEEFTFVARCNIGGERMADGDLERLQKVAKQRWLRTLDDRLGLSNEEQQRLQSIEASPLPCWEPLIADKPEHAVPRASSDPALLPSNPWGFQQQVPELLYQRGELYNLSVSRGTLSSEERFKINEHIVQTIVMLSKLPYPRHLKSVPEIAGGHHEKMDGTGYPKRLKKHEMSLPARMMAIADIFEALTAGDRPYKSAKPLSEALGIMANMAATHHIDAELFELFVRSGVARRYALAHMEAQHVDAVDEEALLLQAKPA